MSRNFSSSSSARILWACDRRTWRTIGSCSGGLICSGFPSSHTWNAVNCSSKNGEFTYGFLLAIIIGNCDKATSKARSQAAHIGCLKVWGKAGDETGVQSYERKMRSASRKFLNKLATSRSCLKSVWKSSRGSVFQAIVSVMAVKIQFNSPSIVRRSLSTPGIFSIMTYVTCGTSFDVGRMANHFKAVLIGVVKHEVNRSAGSSGFIGKIWSDEQAASWIQFL